MGCCASAVQGEVPATKGWEMLAENVPGPYDGSTGPYCVHEKTGKREILFAATGPASKEACPPMTFPAMFKKASESAKDKPALLVEWPCPEVGEDGKVPPVLPKEEWKTITWGQYYDDCYSMAKLFIENGVERFDGVIIYGFNTPWWIMSEMSGVLAGALPVGIYPTDTLAQLEYKSKYADASVACCGDKKHYDAFASSVNNLPDLKLIICWNNPEDCGKELTRADGTTVKVMSWDDAVAAGKELASDKIEARLSTIEPAECAALCFTSGTTGNPKAVMLSHDALTFQARATINVVPGVGLDVNNPERTLSYLPLSHVAGQVVDILVPMIITADKPSHVELYFTRYYDLKAGSLGDRLKFVKPTTFLGVPRVWEKVAAKIRAAGAKTKGLKKKLATAAKGRGLAYSQNRQIGGNGVIPSGYDFYNKLILQKVKAALGMEEVKLAITGAAPMSKDLQVYFASLGINILDTYGMSECGGATTCNTLECCLWGTVGQPIPGCEVRVFQVDENDVNKKTEAPRAKDQFNPTEEEQGEVCFRGRHIMLGYYANPKLGEEHVAEVIKKNAETIDTEGFLHSGDKGCFGENNFFCITGRYKELIIGAGGENISPVPIEDAIKNVCPALSNVIMIGDQRKFNTALVTLRTVGATGEFPGTDQLDPDVVANGSEGTTTVSQAIKDKKWIDLVSQAIKDTNENGNVVHSNAFRIQKFTILRTDLSIVNGEFTPTLKTKRAFIDKKFKPLIDAMYECESMYFECPAELDPNFEEASAPVSTNEQEATKI